MKNFCRPNSLRNQRVAGRREALSAMGIVMILVVAVVLFNYGMWANRVSSGSPTVRGTGGEAIVLAVVIFVGVTISLFNGCRRP